MRRRHWLGGCLGVILVGAFLVGAAVERRAALIEPEPTRLLLDRRGQFLGEVGGEALGRGYWPLAEVPWRVAAATLALEDRRFTAHQGVDLRAIARAAQQNHQAGRTVSGASTIAMQVARMQHPGPRTYPRKALEALVALRLTHRHGRDAVLAQYLTLAPYGNGIHGIDYAARRYLDKPVDDLSWAETAFLTAIPQSPSRMNPYDPRGHERAVTRGRRILDQIREQDLMTQEAYDLAQDEIGRLALPARPERPVVALHPVLEMERRLAHRSDLPARLVTSLDLELQTQVQTRVNEIMRTWRKQGAGNAAVRVLDRATGEIRASVGSTGYFDDRHSGSIDYTHVPRNPGSTLKPFFYAMAFDRGHIDPATVMDDLHRAPDGIGNADGAHHGPMLPRQALANSRNVPAVELVAALGVHEGYALLSDLELHDEALPASHYGLGLAVGGLPVTLSELTTAYLALATDGHMREPSWIRGQPAEEGRRVFSEESARRITRHLADPLARLPTFPRMGSLELPFPVAMKTGTSTDFRDAWAVAWSERYVIGAWVGHPDHRPMAGLSGARGGAELARRLLLDLHADQRHGFANLAFPPPEGQAPIELCALTGQRATSACDRTSTEHFTPGTEPTDRCTAHRRLEIDTRDGQLARASTPDPHRRQATFLDLPPHYAAWQARQGLPRPPTGVQAPAASQGTSSRAPGTEAPVQVEITFPRDGQYLMRDPEIPADRATISLQAEVDPPVEQVVWYVDGEPFEVVAYPYATRWPLRAGEHRFEARVPFTDERSRSVRVAVQ